MGKPSDAIIAKTFELFRAAAVAGERAPMNSPHGPANSDATRYLVKTGRIRVEIYLGNWRRVVIPTEAGEIATASCPRGGTPYMVNGVGRRPRANGASVSVAPLELDARPRAGSPSPTFATSLTVPKGKRLVSVAPLPPRRAAAFNFGDPAPERSELARRLAEQNTQ